MVYMYIYIYWLVVEPTHLKNDGVNVSWDDDNPNMMGKKKSCSKPPTSVFLCVDDSLRFGLWST